MRDAARWRALLVSRHADIRGGLPGPLRPRLNAAVAESSFLAVHEAQAAGATDSERAAILKAYVGAWGVLEAVLDAPLQRPGVDPPAP